MKRQTKIFVLSLIPGTILGWIWGWWHYTSGAWSFPEGAITGIMFFNMPFEDWLFYPITNAMCCTIVIFDPLKSIFKPKKTIGYNMVDEILLCVVFVLLLLLVFIGIFLLGKSATMTAVFFGVPSVLYMCVSLNDINIWHLLRSGLLIVPIELVWDHWAVGLCGQWEYHRGSGVFSNFWVNNIPIDMTPFMPIIATYFAFSVVKFFEKVCK